MNDDVMYVPVNVPQSFEFLEEQFYVRVCYDVYYQEIMDLRAQYKYISVTGTPGIGTSMFYLYFFERYGKENPQKSLVTASFTKDQKLMKCVLFRHDDDGRECIEEKTPYIPLRSAPDWPADEDCDLYLYDGPPEIPPQEVKNMIAFTSPNFGWFDSMRKDQNHTKVYMPVWTFHELMHAIDVLQLDVSTEVLIR